MAADQNFLAGEPDAMTSYLAEGPVAPAPAGSEMSSRMVESYQFAVSDQRANRKLLTFATTAGQGIRSYNSTANASGMNYMAADEESTTNFTALANPAAIGSMQGPTLTPLDR